MNIAASRVARIGTDASGAMGYRSPWTTIRPKAFLNYTNTTASWQISPETEATGATTSGTTLKVDDIQDDLPQRTISELRRLSGLTWEQIAHLFDVSPRSLHAWASGQRLNAANEARLNRLIGVIRYIDRGSASLNRSLLLQSVDNDKIVLDLLIEGDFEAVKSKLRTGNTISKPTIGALSDAECSMRKPLSPEILAEALPEIGYHQSGKSRPARSRRAKP